MRPGGWLVDGGDVDPVLVRDEDRGDEGKEEEEDDTDEADETERAAREQSQEIQDRVGESGHAVAEGRAGERRDAHPFAPPARPMRGSSFA